MGEESEHTESGMQLRPHPDCTSLNGKIAFNLIGVDVSQNSEGKVSSGTQ